MYKDTRGLVTVGVGCMIPDVRTAVTYPFRFGEDGANADQISEDFARVSAMPAGHSPAFYLHEHASPRLSPQDIANIAETRLVGEFIPQLVKLCFAFDAFPLAAKRALCDMIWNLGQHGLAKFHNLLGDINVGNWRGAAQECHRSTCREERNQFVKNLFLQAAGEV